MKTPPRPVTRGPERLDRDPSRRRTTTHVARTATVEPGVFTSERSISFVAGDRKVALLVDAGDVEGDLLRVTVTGEHDGKVRVRLPRDPANGGRDVTIDAGDVVRTGRDAT